MVSHVTPEHILQIGMGFMGSKTLLSAVELELFTVLGHGAMTAAQIGDRLALHPRGLHDFLDALVAMRLLERDGNGADAAYRNTKESALFLDKASPRYLGGILEMANSRLYPNWSRLTQALRTGEPQDDLKHGQGSPFENVYADEAKLEEFLRAMQGIQLDAVTALAEKVDFSRFRTLCDVGGANGNLSATVSKRHPHLSCTSFDLPPVEPVARRHIEAVGASGRVTVKSGDFFRDALPSADVITMGNILHDWTEEEKKLLIRKAYDALNPGGMYVVIESIIDDERRRNAFGLLMSLNMLIALPGGFDFTGKQFDGWCRAAGFARTEVVPLAGPTSAAIAYK